MLNFYPNKVFGYFEKISSIPHGSYNTEKIADFLEGFAKSRGLRHLRDKANNVVIYKNAGAGYENSGPVILQGHTDMVCASEGEFDFINNSISITTDGEFVFANGTTLGADNGIAVAMMLALLDSESDYPALECVFTSDEEVGMLGAIALDMNCLSGKKMINIDSEEEGIFTIGCAGGVSCEISLPVSSNAGNVHCYRLALKGLHGGHSGVEINSGYANGIRILADFIDLLSQKYSLKLVDFTGGVADNAIPKTAECVFASVDVSEADITFAADELTALVTKNFNEPDFGYELTDLGMCDANMTEDTANIISLIKSLPDGVLSYETNIADAVKTSCNTGIAALKDGTFSLRMSLRSSVNNDRAALSDSLKTIVNAYGAEIEFSGSYPAWEPVKDSQLCRIASRMYKSMYGSEPIINVIHAGLECSVFSHEIEGLDCISIGPELMGIHTPQEKMNIASVGRVYDFICELLKNI